MIGPFLFALLVASVAAQRAQVTVNPIQFVPGNEYEYELSSRLLSGIPELADQYAGQEMEATLKLRAVATGVVSMQLEDVRLAQIHRKTDESFEEDIEAIHRQQRDFQRWLTQPLRFVHELGRVKEFEVEQSEPTWSVNIKKGILSLFNINLHPQKVLRSQKGNLIPEAISMEELRYYGIYERSVAGICETTYEINAIPDEDDLNPHHARVLNVTKVRNYDNCLTEPSMVSDNFDSRGCVAQCRKEKSFSAVRGYIPVPDPVNNPYMTGCKCGQEPEASPIDQYNFVKYNMSLHDAVPIIESAWSEGKVIYRNGDAQLMVITHQNLTLQRIAPARSLALLPIQSPSRHESLQFRMPRNKNRQQGPLDNPMAQLYSPQETDEMLEALPTLVETIANEIINDAISGSKKTPSKVRQLVNALATLKDERLEEAFRDIAQPGHAEDASDKDQVKRQVFLDALALSGNNRAAILIKRLIQNNLVSTFEAKQLVEAVPQNLFLADIETIDAYLELCTNPKVVKQRHLFASTCLAFGKLVHEGCVKPHMQPGDLPDAHRLPHDKRNMAARVIATQADPRRQQQQQMSSVPMNRIARQRREAIKWEDQFVQDVCEERDIQKYVAAVEQLLDGVKKYHQKVVLVETLAHMAVPQSLQALEPFISGKVPADKCPGYEMEQHEDKHEECNFLRTVVITSLQSIAQNYPKQVLPLLLPVYRNPTEPYEVRLAALNIILQSEPDTQVLTSIASELHRETNKQVKSYTISVFEALANASLPCRESVSDSAKKASDLTPDEDFPLQYSKAFIQSFYDEDDEFGVAHDVQWIANNISSFPRFFESTVKQSNGPFTGELYSLYFNAKGVQKMLKRIAEPNGLMSDALEAHTTKRNKRNTDSAGSALEALKTKLNLRHRSSDDTKAAIIFKLFEQTSMYALDEKYVREVIDSADDVIAEWIKKAVDGFSGHLVKVFMPHSFDRVVPSEIGIPVHAGQAHPLILSLKVKSAKLDLASHPKTPIPVGFNFTASIQARAMYSNTAFITAVSRGAQKGYAAMVTKKTQVNLPFEISVGAALPKNLVTLSIVPEAPKEIFFHKSQASTVIYKPALIYSPTGESQATKKPIRTQAAPFAFDTKWGQEQLGLGVQVEMKSENPWMLVPFWNSETAQEHGKIPALLEELNNPSQQNREVHVTLKPDEEFPTYGIDMTLQYKWISDEETGMDSDDSDESSASDESDSDESDASSSSSSSESDESNDSKSGSKSSGSRSSKSSASSESSSESESSNESKSKSSSKGRKVKLVLRHKIKNKSPSDLKSSESSASSESSGSSSSASSESDSGSSKSESSASSKSSKSSESDSESSSEDSSSSSSSESSDSASSSSSSSESDESFSLEDEVFDYEDVLSLILGKSVPAHEIKKIAMRLLEKTKRVWEDCYDDIKDDSKSGESSGIEKDIVPMTITHDIELTVVLRGPRPTYFAANAMYIHSIDERIHWIKTDGHIKSPIGVYMELPTLFCAESVVAYPAKPGTFYFDPTAMQNLKAKVRAELGWGSQCKGEGGVLVTGVMEKTEDTINPNEKFNLQAGANGQSVRAGYYRQCEIDRSEGKPSSEACQEALYAQSQFNKMILDIQYKNVPSEIANLTQKLDLALKHRFYENMDNNAQDVDNPDNTIRIIAEYSDRVPGVPMASFRIEKPEENTEFNEIFAGDLKPASALASFAEHQKWSMGYQNYDMCTVMEKNFVRTFDNVTYEMPENECQYLVAMDCSPKEQWAVFSTDMDDEANTKRARVFIDGRDFTLRPPQQQDLAQIQVDGSHHELGFREPLSFCGGKGCTRVFLQKVASDAYNPIVKIENPRLGLWIEYDGKNVRVSVRKSDWKGKLCGLCGDNDDETDDEFVGPAQCIYDEAEDFVNSYSMGGEACEKVERPRGKVFCPKHPKSPAQIEAKVQRIVDDVNKMTETAPLAARRFQGVNQQAARVGSPLTGAAHILPTQPEIQLAPVPSACQRMVTQVIRRGDNTCFSTKPVMQCSPECRAQSSRDLMTEYHCLPNASQFTKKLVADAVRKVLQQVANKRVDIREQLSVPVQCIGA